MLVAGVALLASVFGACTTDVVSFPAAQRDAAPDYDPKRCSTTESIGKRCTQCQDPKTGTLTTTCEDLVCKYVAEDAGATKCKTCWWSKHPKDLCEICTVNQAVTNTCADKDAGP